jgi:methylphosphotriester-DNA--protein-cysteine methyltransferase
MPRPRGHHAVRTPEAAGEWHVATVIMGSTPGDCGRMPRRRGRHAVRTAADRLRDSEDTLEAIARRVGYGSAFVLSSAFKRVYGVSPQEYRRSV